MRCPHQRNHVHAKRRFIGTYVCHRRSSSLLVTCAVANVSPARNGAVVDVWYAVICSTMCFPYVLHVSVVSHVVRRRVPWSGIIPSGRRTQKNNNAGRLELIKRSSEDYDGFAFSFAEYASASLPILIISQMRTITTAVSSIVGISPKPTTKCAGGVASFTPTDSILIVRMRTA